MVTNSYYIRWR